MTTASRVRRRPEHLRAMDARIAAAVRDGVCPGAALAAQAEVMEEHANDPVRAVAALEAALQALLHGAPRGRSGSGVASGR